MTLRQRVDRLLIRREQHLHQIKQERRLLKSLRLQATHVEQARQIAQRVAQAVQQRMHSQVSSLVTSCLHSIYGPRWSFKILFERKAGKTWARPVFVRRGFDERPSQVPGGVRDVACFGLRVACLVLCRPAVRRLLVLDEPLANLNGEIYQQRVAGMIEKLATELKIQFIIVSDDDWLRIGKVVDL